MGSSAGPRLAGACLGHRHGVEIELEHRDGRREVEQPADAGMQLAEGREHGPALPQAAGAAGMIPGRGLGGDLHALGLDAQDSERRQRVALGVDRVDRPRRSRPSAGAPRRRSAAPARATTCSPGRSPVKRGPSSNSAPSSCLRARLRAAAATRFGSSEGRIADSSALSGLRLRIGARGAERRRMLGRDERPGDGLGIAQVGHGAPQRPPGAAGPASARRSRRRRRGSPAPAESGRSRAGAPAPRRCRPRCVTSWRQEGGWTCHSSGPPLSAKPSAASRRSISGASRSMPASRCRRGRRKRTAGAGAGHGPGDRPPDRPRRRTARGSAASRTRSPGRTSSGSSPRSKRVRASLSMPSRAAGGRRAQRIEQRHLEHDRRSWPR